MRHPATNNSYCSTIALIVTHKSKCWYGVNRIIIFFPHWAAISDLCSWFPTILEWFPMFFLCEVIPGKNKVEEIDHWCLRSYAGRGSPSWVCIPQKSLAIVRDFWNTNSGERVNSVPHGRPWWILYLQHVWIGGLHLSTVIWVRYHYNDVIIGMIASQITSLTLVYPVVYSDADQRKHQSSASLAFVRGIHRDRWILRTNGQLGGKCFQLMTSSWSKDIPPMWFNTKYHTCEIQMPGVVDAWNFSYHKGAITD